MADNTTLNAGSGGNVVRTLEDGSSIHYPVGVVAYATTVGTPDVISIPTAAALADNMSNPTTLLGGSCLLIFDGSTWDRAPGSSTDGLLVNLGSNNDVTVTGTVSISGTVTVGSHAVTNAGTFAVQVDGAALTALQLIDDAVSGSGFNISQMNGVNVTMGNGASGTGVQRVTLANDSTGVIASVGSITNALPAGTNNIGDVDVLSIAAGDNNIGNVDIATVPSDPFGANADAASATGSISAKLRFIASTGIPITGTVTVGSHAVTNAGTFAVQESGGALTALQIMDDWDNAASDGASVSGDVAHDSPDAGEPVKTGFKASTALSGLTLVANADRTDGYAGIDGVQITRPHCNLEDIVSGNASNTDGTSTACIAAGAAGIKHYLTLISLTNTSASDIYVEIKDGATAKLTIPVPAGGGAIVPLTVPLPGSAATAWNFDPSAAASTVYCSMVAFKSKV